MLCPNAHQTPNRPDTVEKRAQTNNLRHRELDAGYCEAVLSALDSHGGLDDG